MTGFGMRMGLAGGGIVVLLAVGALTTPLWLRPVVQAQASATLGRNVRIGALAVHVFPMRIVATDIVVAGGADAPPLATVAKIATTLDIAPIWHLQLPAIPEIAITGMDVQAVQTQAGDNNYTLNVPPDSGGPTLAIGVVRFTDSQAHLLMPQLGADLTLVVHTDAASDGEIIGELSGVYRGQKATGHIKTGGVLSLRDGAQAFPIDVLVQSGASRFSLAGTMLDPLHLGGAKLKVGLKGQDLARLYPLTGIPFPPTTPYDLSSALDFDGSTLHFTNIAGRLGNSDLQGNLDLDIRPQRPVMSGSLLSHKVDLEDLAGFIGSQPGRDNTPGQTPDQQQAVAKAEASAQLIPNLPMDIPKIRSADFHVIYRGESIIGVSVPFDSLAAKIDIDDGHIHVTDLRVGVGRGQILGQIDMTPINEGAEDSFHTVADIRLQNVDVGRMLSKTDLVRGTGTLGGQIHLESKGKSLAEILTRGDGHVALFMAGGDVSSLVIDLSGLHLGAAVLSALGIPDRAPVRCLIGDLSLANGVLQTQTVMLDTDKNRTTLDGSIDLRNEIINAQLRTQPKHFTIATLATPFAVTGRIKSPDFAPEVAELGARSAGAVGLGLLFPPAALLATIQLGIGEDNACVSLVKDGQKAR